jgi:hypothetical protein
MGAQGFTRRLLVVFVLLRGEGGNGGACVAAEVGWVGHLLVAACPCLFTTGKCESARAAALPRRRAAAILAGRVVVVVVVSMAISKYWLVMLCAPRPCLPQLTDTAIVELSTCCHELRTLDLSHLAYITDTALVSLAKHCTKLTSLNLEGEEHCAMLRLRAHARPGSGEG